MSKRRKKSLRGTKTSGNWWDKHSSGRVGKNCHITPSASIHDVKECARICKTPFFDRDTMRFFNSRIGSRAYYDGHGGAYFTTSEQGPNGIRAYSIRHYSPKRCGIETVGEFQGYRTSAQADRAAKQIATSRR
jgi:hypothetical protein